MNRHTAYAIQVDRHTVGVVVREHPGFRFFASSKDVASLEGTVFRSAGHAEHACRQHLAQQKRRGQATATLELGTSRALAANRPLS